MRRISACDGRWVSLAQQKRAWEELNRIFGGATPTPPGPDPPGPDPPSPEEVERDCYCVEGIRWDIPPVTEYIVKMEVDGLQRMCLRLFPNNNVTLASRPQLGLRKFVGLVHYRGGQKFWQYGGYFQSDKDHALVLECVIYNPLLPGYCLFFPVS